jgi:hypothetical protein
MGTKNYLTKKSIMKKVIGMLLFSVGLYFTTQAQIDSTAKKVGNKTAELTVKGKSAVVDEVYKDKTGADGQSPIYIDHSSDYYYIDKQGKKVYVSKSSLKDKPKS